VSRDRLIDETTKQPYFLALIRVSNETVPPEYRAKMTPGLNTEVIVPTRERTALEYVIEPLTARLRTAFREE
jgi:hypothetical protein